jgi:hypothetical protein
MNRNDFALGFDYVSEPNALKTFGISVGGHGNQVEVHGDEKLRDHVLRLLRQHPPTGDAPQPARNTALWPNGVERTAIAALRYLSTHDRPSGGEQSYNWAHLNQLADELQEAVNRVSAYADERKRDRKLRIEAEDRAVQWEKSRDDVVTRYNAIMRLIGQIEEIGKRRPNQPQPPSAAPEPTGKAKPEINAEAFKAARTAAIFALPDPAIGVLNRERDAREADGATDPDPLGEAVNVIIRTYLKTVSEKLA